MALKTAVHTGCMHFLHGSHAWRHLDLTFQIWGKFKIFIKQKTTTTKNKKQTKTKTKTKKTQKTKQNKKIQPNKLDFQIM